MRHFAFSQLHPRQKGVAAVEMAIMLPLLVLVFTGMIEYGRLMWNYDALAKATRDAARFLAEEQAPPTTPPGPKITDAMKDTARNMVRDTALAAGVKGLVVDNTGIPISCSPDCTSPYTITVGVSYAFTIGGWVPVIGRSGATRTDVTLSPHTTMRYMR